MFNQLPRQVNKDTIWGRYWRKVTKSLLKEAQNQAPLLKPGKKGRIGVPYPPDKSKTIGRGTLKKSIGFFRTRESKGDIHGAYVGPRVKGKFAKNKGGYYGAWVEFGDQVMHFGKFKSEGNPFMKRAWNAKGMSVSQNGIKEAEKIFDSAVKSHTKRMKKYGLGY